MKLQVSFLSIYIKRYLLDSGANPNVVTNDGHRPIDLIESDDLTSITQMLIRIQKASK
jgi:hypothetical protein